MVAMATTLSTGYCKLFYVMPYIIILKVRKFHQPTASRLSTARKKPVGGTLPPPPPSLNRVKISSGLTRNLGSSLVTRKKLSSEDREILSEISDKF